MIKSVEFIKDLFCFKAGDSFTFEKLTILVGDQGCGKSTLLKLLSDQGLFGSTHILKINIDNDHTNNDFIFHDFEKGNHRTDHSKVNPNDSEGYVHQISKMMNAMSMSHGEYAKDSFVDFDELSQNIFIIDEPDMALSIRSVKKLVMHINKWLSAGKQVIMSCHHPYLIEEFDKVYSLEHKKWISPIDFIHSHLNDE